MAALTDLTVAEAATGLNAGDFTARELTDAYLAAMEDAEDLNAYTAPTPERATPRVTPRCWRTAVGVAPLMGRRRSAESIRVHIVAGPVPVSVLEFMSE